ncbi:hypothetical protein [Chitinophaga pinensis]|uniref:Uncharacterized protein n=1 Tax=Chitinophaga pinensis (strain ATCC 43595 / DSM 2588 / LMG 13176 / NBRC 15968 / NCIMB 11800 / UQM 2034) TaxID=485918 RepID=A0A979G5U7_CHIPD|nr:hypothetical protein [Chitinophaga pinensis]ACU61394.1 hypothetical protein Cpin_3932 [Chitinophaga pinensis DSM 2588]
MKQIPLQISRDKERDNTLDFTRLRAEALTLVQELSGHVWTDYNLHDPGVTILEQLCFALTDLAYKTDFPINEILADKEGRINPRDNVFFSKADILNSGPISISDFRKLVLDQVDRIENVWIEPVMSDYTPGASKGVFRVLIQPDDALTRELETNIAAAEKMVEVVRNCLMRNRNLGENFEEISILKAQHISIKATIMVDAHYPVKETLAYICNAIEQVVHPPVRFISEAELLEAGYATEDIYQGPELSKGFVPDEDLRERKPQVDPSEMVKAISQLPGVIQVKFLHVSSDGVNFSSKPIIIQPGYYPYVDITDARNDIGIFSDQFEQHSRDAVFWNVFRKIRETRKRHYTAQEKGLADHSLEGAYRNSTQYYSLQHFFPAIYGTGEEQLSRHEPPIRIAQAKQLKAYLLFFEQILADYLAQLGNLSAIFSPDIDSVPASTYFSQPLYDVPHVKHLLKAFTESGKTWEDFKKDKDNDYVSALREMAEGDALYQQRKIRIFDHLLARFNIVVPRYPVSLYDLLYHPPDEKIRINCELRWKAGILQQLPVLLKGKIQGYNYMMDPEMSGVFSGYQQWIYKMLHIERDVKQPLTAVFDRDHLDMSVSGAWHPVPIAKQLQVNGESIWFNDDIPDTAIDTKQYHFGHQPISLLKFGTDQSHYRIVEDEGNGYYVVLYKAPGQHTWHAAAKHRDREAAITAMHQMIRHLQVISADSEGFYIVEHTLLKPTLRMRAYGFRLLSFGGKLLLELRLMRTFEERENILKRLLETNWEAMSPADMYQQLTTDCLLYTQTASFDNDMQEIARMLAMIAAGHDAQYPKMEYYIDSGNGQALPDSFYRPAITIVLPSWPARFQYAEFRKFTEDLIREQTPVYYKVSFRWLGIADMRHFENIYFPWLKAVPDLYLRGTIPAQRSRLLDFLTKNRKP